MRELIRMGTLALLLWADRNDVEVTLWELYRFFQEGAWCAKVLTGGPKPIRDAFAADEARKQTLQAVRAQLRRSVTSENLLVALAQRDGIDPWSVMEQERWLLCDTPEAILGPEVAAFLCQVIASRLQMLTSRRPAGSQPFLVGRSSGSPRRVRPGEYSWQRSKAGRDGQLRRMPHPIFRNGSYCYTRSERTTTHGQKVLHHLAEVDFHLAVVRYLARYGARVLPELPWGPGLVPDQTVLWREMVWAMSERRLAAVTRLD